MDRFMKVGLYGGTFDPLHFGHLHLANEMLARHKLDAIWFLPASISPHKLESPPTSPEHRCRMLDLGLEGLPQFSFNDLEIRRGGTSYTIDTVNKILSTPELAEGHAFVLIIADEMVPSLARWKDMEKLVDLLPLLVGRRSHEPLAPTGLAAVDAAVNEGFTEMPVLEISATTVRERIHEGLSCRHLVPARVLAYIYENNLYCG